MTTELPVESEVIAPATVSPTRPLYWSIRRELWENRSIYLAPLIVAGVLLFGLALSMIGMPERRRIVLRLDEIQQRAVIEQPYAIIGLMLIATGLIVGVFYCLDALHGERRDRSILFWKSLPVSDLTAILSKASVPLVVLPLLLFVLIVALHLMIAGLSTAVLLGGGFRVSTIASQLRFIPSPLVVLYALIVIALWHAPVYAWLLLVSAWAKRAAFLWAILPVVAMAFFERIAFGSNHFLSFVRYRLFGAFVPDPQHCTAISRLSGLTPIRFLIMPGLWFGLLFAALFLALAVRLRRDRGPI